ncbi:hypothetical protein [Nocardia abscessus]|uniref:hypothetical protein n=1 Tax=Nocardia abscessus TaxID=120957 RepID=UPI0024541C80|nr:hypothetical protein [Nocardia abscessus]
MGQYYKAILLTDDTNEIICYLTAWDYDNFVKLTEHSWIGNEYVEAVEALLAQPTRVVWAGDSAPKEPGTALNLFMKANSAPKAQKTKPLPVGGYVVNHDKRLYVDKSTVKPNSHGFRLHPLPILTAEGNGRGGGDLFPGNTSGNYELVGTWARDRISVSHTPPEGYDELTFNLIDN